MLNNDWKSRADRYLAINAWLQRRYRGKSVGRWSCRPAEIIRFAGGIPTTYERLDRGFFERYVLG